MKEHRPWIPIGTIEFLENFLQDDMVGFEYGAGHSTIWIAKRIKHLVSVEHNKEWYDRVQGWLKRENITNVDLFYIPANKDCKESFCFYFGTDHMKMCYKNYVNTLNKYLDNSFDFVFVDGRARVGCLLLAMSKAETIILDNANRDRYKVALDALLPYKCISNSEVIDGQLDIAKVFVK